MEKIEKPLKSLLVYGRSYKGWLILCAIFSLFDVIVVGVAMPYMYKLFIDKIPFTDNNNLFVQYVIIIFILLLLQTVNVFIKELSTRRFAAYTLQHLRNNVASHVQKLPYFLIRKKHSGDLTSRVNDDIELINNLLMQTSNFIYQPLIFISAIILGLLLSWKLLLTTMIVLVFAMVLNNVVSKPMQKISKKLQSIYGKSSSLIQDTVKGVHIVKSYLLQKKFKSDYKNKQNTIYSVEMSIAKRRLIIMTIQTFLLVVPMLIINLYGGHLTFTGDITLGDFTAFLAIITFLTHPINIIIELISKVRLARGGAERIHEILSHPTEKITKKKVIFVERNDVSVELKNVSFSYDDKQSILNNINIQLEKGKTIALVGVSGGGKSTILNLICGFYPHFKGEINVFGNNINELDLVTLRNQISMVTQDTHIYPATILENIGYGKSNSSKDEIIHAAKLANAHDFIIEFKEGYNTFLQEGGSNLSGGQKQRIAIARAILKDAPILLLDEPTSALDQATEKLIDESLVNLMKRKSVIIVAHRFSTIKNADEIIVLDKGRVVEQGTHHTLMKKNGVYKELYLKQFEGKEVAINV